MVAAEIKNRPPGEEVDAGLRSLGDAMATSFRILKLIIAILLLLFLASGIKYVEQHEVALHLRFGRRVSTLKPGLKWSFPRPIDEIVRLPARDRADTVTVERFWYQETGRVQLRREAGASPGGQGDLIPGRDGFAVTGDFNVVHCRCEATFFIRDPVRYFLSVRGAEEKNIETGIVQAAREIVRAAVMSAVIREVGKRPVDDVLREDLAGLRRAIEESSQEILDEMDCGIGIRSVDIVKMIPPQAVQQAFHDTFLAGQEASEIVNEAKSYRKRVLSEAAGSAGEGIASVIAEIDERREAGEDTGELEEELDDLLMGAGGDVARAMSEAQTYRQGVVARAEADARYLADILSEYEGKPKMLRLFLRDKLLEATEHVMATAERKWVVPSGGKIVIPIAEKKREPETTGP